MLASHIRLLVQVLAAVLLIQLIASVPGKAVDDGPSASAFATTWEPLKEF